MAIEPIVFSEEEKITLGAAFSKVLDVADDDETEGFSMLLVRAGIWALCKDCGGTFFAGDRCGCAPPQDIEYSEPEGET